MEVPANNRSSTMQDRIVIAKQIPEVPGTGAQFKISSGGSKQLPVLLSFPGTKITVLKPPLVLFSLVTRLVNYMQ